MASLILLTAVLLILLDLICISDAKKIVKQFLWGRYNRKHAEQIFKEQPVEELRTMKFIGPHLKKYKKEFEIYRRIYMGLKIAVFPQYSLLLVCLGLLGLSNKLIYFCILPLLVIKAAFCVHFAYVLGPNKISKFGK